MIYEVAKSLKPQLKQRGWFDSLFCGMIGSNEQYTSASSGAVLAIEYAEDHVVSEPKQGHQGKATAQSKQCNSIL